MNTEIPNSKSTPMKSRITHFFRKITALICVFFLPLLSLYWTFKGWHWLSIPLIVLVLAFVVYLLNPSLVRKVFKRPFLSYGILFVITICAAIYVRIFLFEVYMIPSNSMSDTIRPGDRVWVEKWSYGPRMPSSILEIPWLNVMYFVAHKIGIKPKVNEWPYKRLKGTTGIKHNDLLVFNMGEYPGQTFIKRCVALPGDTLQIKNAIVYVNGDPLSVPEGVRHYMRITYVDFQYVMRTFNDFNIMIDQHCKANLFLYAFMNQQQVKALANSTGVTGITIETERLDSDWITEHWYVDDGWTVDNFGPIVLPYKGMKLEKTNRNKLLYKTAMRANYFGSILEFSDSVMQPKEFIFLSDFYFVLGDHRHDSRDSRYTGFVPEKDIVGKARFVLYNQQTFKSFSRPFRQTEDDS